MINAASLKTRTVKELAAMAKRKRVPGWHSMRKDELIKALVKLAKSEAAKSSRKGNSRAGKRSTQGASAKSATKNGRDSRQNSSARKSSKPARSERRLKQIRAKIARSQDLAFDSNGQTKDRLVVMVRDSYWLQTYWEVTRASVERARVALGQHWHAARPVLRLLKVAHDGTTNTEREVVRDIEVHGGVNNWYVDVKDPPQSFQLDLGYLAPDGRFLCLIRSNVVTTPQSGSADDVDGNWADVAHDYERIYALSGGYTDDPGSCDLKNLFEERLRRPMGSPMVTRFGRGAQRVGHNRPEFPFQVDAELVVYGVTDPNAHVTLKGEPVRIQPDGTFTVRFSLPDRRQVLPVVASSGDGVEQRTIVLAVERNTKVMEPVIREPDA